MQKVVNDVIDIFASEDMGNMPLHGYFLVKHSHLYNKYYYVCILEFLVLFRAKMALTTYACIAGLVVPVPKALPRIRSNKQELGLTRY